MTKGKYIRGEYELRGEYHKQLDPDWPYYPTYLAKMKFIRSYLCKIPLTYKILDLGCGEGILLEEFKNLGYNIIGLDQNYSSEFVIRGDIKETPFPDHDFDVILCLDVIEHLDYESQRSAIAEIKRLLKDKGIAILTIPNLAHCYSRLRFLLIGQLDRTARIEKHPGDRPIAEHLQLLRQEGFKVIQRKGLFPTLPVIYQLIQRWPSKTLWLYNLLNRLLPLANYCFLNILVVQKKASKI
ncbi:MAG: methyltransferase domain-containing protein [Chloroflexota bacterium]|nr:class I SAM-dependent methyltransferase [Chloroflexota bacterium]